MYSKLPFVQNLEISSQSARFSSNMHVSAGLYASHGVTTISWRRLMVDKINYLIKKIKEIKKIEKVKALSLYNFRKDLYYPLDATRT